MALQTKRKHGSLCKVLSLFQNISVTQLGQKSEKKNSMNVVFVAWTPDTTEIVHAVYWVSSVCRYCTGLLTKLCCMVNISLLIIITRNLQFLCRVCVPHEKHQYKVEGDSWELSERDKTTPARSSLISLEDKRCCQRWQRWCWLAPT